MARRRRADKRKILPDTVYHDLVLAKFINQVMNKGKKSVAKRLVYGALNELEAMSKENSLEVFTKAIDNIKPRLEVKSRRVGGATYQVPIEVSTDRRLALALRWLIQYAQARKGMPMKRALAQELMDAYQNQGASVKKRDDTHKMAQANKAFAHYRW